MKQDFRPLKSISLQTRMMINMASLLLLISVLLAASLHWSQFFHRVNQQSIDDFYSKAQQKVTEINLTLANIVENVVETSEHLSQFYVTETALYREDILTADLTSTRYLSTRVDSVEFLLSLLDNVMIDGAFYVLFQEVEQEYTGVHVRNLYPTRMSKNRDNYELLVGSSSISQKYQLSISTQWDLYFHWENIQDHSFLEKPLEAMALSKQGKLETFGYWSFPESQEEEPILYYTVPMLNELGEAYGILGVEISHDFFCSSYLSTEDFNYENSFHFLGNVENNLLEIHSSTPNVPIASGYLEKDLTLTYANIVDYPLFTTSIQGQEELLCTVHPLQMYSNTSPFYDLSWDFLTLVPKSQPNQYSEELITIFVNCFALVMILGMVGTVGLAHLSTRKIVGLSEYVNNLNPHQALEFEPTDLKEIDDLTAAVKRLNQKVIDSNDTLDRIIKLTNLNLGGFEIHPKDNTVVLTEYIRNLFSFSADEWLSVEEWERYYQDLTRQPATDVDNTYLYHENGKKIWLRVLESANEEGSFGVVMDITQEMEESIQVKTQLDYDALTKLYSRAAFHRESKKLIQQDPDMVGAMLFIDLDNLKYTNDTFGHEAGDHLIQSASEIFDQFSMYGGIAARFSGDEFAIFIHGFESQKKILKIITQKFTQCKNASIKVPDGTEQRIRFSTGIAWYPQDAEDVPKLVKLADFAMYQAKHNAKGTLREFDQKIYEETAYMMDNREAINKLIEESLVRFKYQPIVDLKTGEVFAYEALMRSELEAFKSPLEILNVAKAQSKSGELEKMLIQKTIAHAYENRHIIGDRKIFINSITSQSVSGEDFLSLKQMYGDFLCNIVIEIKQTEAERSQSHLEKVQNLRNYGMQIAIDDFTAGFSNEMSLGNVDPDLVKMDMSLGQGIATDKSKRDFLKSNIAYPQEKGIKIIMEGIEELEDLEQVMLLGADYVQGYVIAHPSFEFLEIAPEKKQQILNFQKTQ